MLSPSRPVPHGQCGARSESGQTVRYRLQVRGRNANDNALKAPAVAHPTSQVARPDPGGEICPGPEHRRRDLRRGAQIAACRAGAPSTPRTRRAGLLRRFRTSAPVGLFRVPAHSFARPDRSDPPLHSGLRVDAPPQKTSPAIHRPPRSTTHSARQPPHSDMPLCMPLPSGRIRGTQTQSGTEARRT